MFRFHKTSPQQKTLLKSMEKYVSRTVLYPERVISTENEYLAIFSLISYITYSPRRKITTSGTKLIPTNQQTKAPLYSRTDSYNHFTICTSADISDLSFHLHSLNNTSLPHIFHHNIFNFSYSFIYTVL